MYTSLIPIYQCKYSKTASNHTDLTQFILHRWKTDNIVIPPLQLTVPNSFIE